MIRIAFTNRKKAVGVFYKLFKKMFWRWVRHNTTVEEPEWYLPSEDDIEDVLIEMEMSAVSGVSFENNPMIVNKGKLRVIASGSVYIYTLGAHTEVVVDNAFRSGLLKEEDFQERR